MSLPTPPRIPFSTTVALIVGLRFRLLARKVSGAGWLGGTLTAAAMLGVAGGIGVGGYLLFSRLPIVQQSRIWMAFFLGLYFFLLGVFWVLWPVIAAQVDDAYELGRYLHYPVRPARLYAIQTVAGLLEPSTLFFYPALIGAGLGLAETLRPGWLPTVALMLCFTFMNVATGRALLNAFLNVMVSRRSAEILLSGFLVALGLAALLPPVDTSWLTAQLAQLAAAGPNDLGDIIRAASGMTDTPPGWIAYGLRASARGHTATALKTGAGMVVLGLGAWTVGLVLLKRFYRGARPLIARTPTPRSTPRTTSPGWRVPGLSAPTAAVFELELRTLARSPKGRLLFAMPFFLVILLRLVGAAPLFRHLWGPRWTALVLSALVIYVLASLAGQFFSNQFGYDGHAIRRLYLHPVSPRRWLLGRNLAHGVFASVQMTLLAGLLYLVLPHTTLAGALLPVFGFPFGLLLLLGVGNVLSVYHPRPFHFDLSRRDRPAPTSFVGLALTLGLGVGVVASLRLAARLIGWPDAAVLWLLPLLGLVAHHALLPWALRGLATGRERLISAVTAD